MSDLPPAPDSGSTSTAAVDRARSFGAVAEAYDRSRPSYPPEAVAWMIGTGSKRVLELGAGTGKLTEVLLAAGHRVVATDPDTAMLAVLRNRVPRALAMAAPAERLPVASRSFDVVVCGESFHWFDHPQALAEITRVLREDGHLALVWNFRDEGIPWVRKLGRIVNGTAPSTDEIATPEAVRGSEFFGAVESQDFRFWQNLDRPGLLDLVRSRSAVATLPEHQRDDVLARVGALYDDYGRGPDGMQLPYITTCYRAPVVNQPPPPVVMQRVADEAISLVDSTEDDVEHTGELTRSSRRATVREDTGTLLIDFS